MEKRLTNLFRIGDYLTDKTGTSTVFKVILLNYKDNYITLELMYPLETRKGLKGSLYFKFPFNDLKQFELINKQTGSILYG